MTGARMPIWYEDASPGLKARLGSYAFTREVIVDFARKYDPQAFHLDEEAARASHFGALAASGWHTASACMKCWAAHNFETRRQAAARGEALPEIGPSPGYENLQWLKPVYAGDTLTYWWEAAGGRPLASRPAWGLVFSRITGVNQTGETVFSFEGKVLTQRRL